LCLIKYLNYSGPVATKEEMARQAWLRVTALFIFGENTDRFPRIAGELKVTPGQMHALLDLRDGEPRPVRALADTMTCDASYATTLIDGLERAGYVERRVSPTDRRVKLVHVTDAGRRLQAQVIERLSIPPTVFERLTAAELRTLIDLLTKVTDDFPF
jgi:MarR family transcriptional regulator, organic hydroperoxide resistance regulator